MTSVSLLCCAFLFFISVKLTTAYYATIGAHTNECFFEKLVSGGKVLFVYEVVQGGFLDIDIKVTGPDGSQVFSGDRETSGKTTFSAHMEGTYTFCFNNEMSTVTPKVIMFQIEVGDASKLEAEVDEASNFTVNHGKLEALIAELSASLFAVKREQEFMEIRERVHRAINENTNARVVMWSCFEAFILLTMAFGQVYYLKQFFEVRRMV